MSEVIIPRRYQIPEADCRHKTSETNERLYSDQTNPHFGLEYKIDERQVDNGQTIENERHIGLNRECIETKVNKMHSDVNTYPKNLEKTGEDKYPSREHLLSNLYYCDDVVAPTANNIKIIDPENNESLHQEHFSKIQRNHSIDQESVKIRRDSDNIMTNKQDIDKLNINDDPASVDEQQSLSISLEVEKQDTEEHIDGQVSFGEKTMQAFKIIQDVKTSKLDTGQSVDNRSLFNTNDDQAPRDRLDIVAKSDYLGSEQHKFVKANVPQDDKACVYKYLASHQDDLEFYTRKVHLSHAAIDTKNQIRTNDTSNTRFYSNKTIEKTNNDSRADPQNCHLYNNPC